MAIPSSDEFIKRVKQKLGVEKPADIARAIGLTEFSSPQRVGRWISGRNGPDYVGTMLMLDACGWLAINDGANPADRSAEGDEALEVLAEVARSLTDLAQRVSADVDRRRGRAAGE